MTNYILTCCSTADMPQSYFDQRNIPYVCFHYTMDGVQYPDDLGQTMSFDEFYQRVEAGAMPTTSQVNVEQFMTFFEPMLRAGQDVLHLSLSTGISGVYNSACVAQQELMQKYPERKLIVLDSLSASMGYGLLVDAAADRRDAGASIEELAEWVEQNKGKVHHWFYATDLTHLKRGGRISAAAALMGTLLHICPVMNANAEGRLVPRKKIRGKRQAMAELVRVMEQRAQGGAAYAGKCFLSHSACPEDARAIAQMIEQNFPHLDGGVRVGSIGTVIGSHTGVGTAALFFFGDEREM